MCCRWRATTSVNLPGAQLTPLVPSSARKESFFSMLTPSLFLGFTPTGGSKHFLFPLLNFLAAHSHTLISFFDIRIVQKLNGKAKLMAILSKSSSHSHAVVRTRVSTHLPYLAGRNFCLWFAGQASAAGCPEAHGMKCSFVRRLNSFAFINIYYSFPR